MRLAKIQIKSFKRFTDLTISEIPASAKLVVLAGPNGSGKSSLFDALSTLYQQQAQFGWSADHSYYSKDKISPIDIHQRVSALFHNNEKIRKGSMYFRSAYRNDLNFKLDLLNVCPRLWTNSECGG